MKKSKISITLLILTFLIYICSTIHYIGYKSHFKFKNFAPIKMINDKVEKYNITKDIGVIIRSVGERTEQPCIEDMQKIFGKENVYVIKNVTPLAKATQQTMEYIQKTDKKWFLIVDADVIFFEDKLLMFIKESKRISEKDPNALCFQGHLYDKFLFKDRCVGFILYYKKNLNYKKQYMDKCHKKVRPETCLRIALLESKYHHYILFPDKRIGLHAFNQYPKTIVKNGIMYAKKHEISEIREKWKEKSSEDKDMQYIFLGAQIYDSLKDKNIIPDNEAIEKLMKNYDIPDLPYVNRKEIDENIKKYNTSSTIEKINY